MNAEPATEQGAAAGSPLAPVTTLAPKGWWLDPRHRPQVPSDVAVLADEPGRIIPARSAKDHAVDCRSHWFVLVRPPFGAPSVYAQHGGGEEHLVLGYGWDGVLLDAVLEMPSDARFKLLWKVMDLHRDALKQGKDAKWSDVTRAFVEGRLHKRKMPGRDAHKVWMDPPRAAAQAPAEFNEQGLPTAHAGVGGASAMAGAAPAAVR